MTNAPPSPSLAELVRASLTTARDELDRFLADKASAETVAAIARSLAGSLQSGHKLLACGNGGSLCDAVHFCEELTGRFRADRPALAAIALADPGTLTCVDNDFGYEHVFARGVEALGRPGDALIVLSTSGNSANCLRAVDAAKQRSMTTIALLGKGGGELRGICDHDLIAPGSTSDRIQELHMLCLHIMVEAIEHQLFGD